MNAAERLVKRATFLKATVGLFIAAILLTAAAQISLTYARKVSQISI